MLKIILGVIVGFIVWSIVWMGSHQLFIMLLPGSYGAHAAAGEAALLSGESIDTSMSVILINLIRTIATSIIAGYMAALVAGEYGRSTLILGVVLLLVGIPVQYMAWNLAPAWYHILFLALLIPMTILGGRLQAIELEH
jgi:hypothetical protein